MNEFKERQFVHVVIDVNSYDKVQRCIPPVNHFVLPMLKEGALVLRARQTLADKFALESDPFLHAKAIIIFAEASLPLLVDHQYELYHLPLECVCTILTSQFTPRASDGVYCLHNINMEGEKTYLELIIKKL